MQGLNFNLLDRFRANDDRTSIIVLLLEVNGSTVVQTAIQAKSTHRKW
jgi:hypothetical protein